MIAEFGPPPAVPDGPVPEALATALRTAFIDSIEQNNWDEHQIMALEEIVSADDTRVEAPSPGGGGTARGRAVAGR